MSGKNTSVFAIFPNQIELEKAIEKLRIAGFRGADVSLLVPDNPGVREFTHEKGTKAPEGATAGASSGAIIGGALGWLAGVGALAIPGLGPFIAAGPIMGLLSGLGIGGAVGGFTGALIGLGIPEYEAKRYEGRIRSGGLLVSVHCDNSDWADTAKDILSQSGGEDVASASESKADYVPL